MNRKKAIELLTSSTGAVDTWNSWRKESNYAPGFDLSRSDLSMLHLPGINFSGVNLTGANLAHCNLEGSTFEGSCLNETRLIGTNLSESNLTRVEMVHSNLMVANCTNSIFKGSDISWANISMSDFTGSQLQNSNLNMATIVKSKLINANISGCFVYGVSVWDIDAEGLKQDGLVISPIGSDKIFIRVNDIEVAQFINLLISNKNIRKVIDCVSSKVVLILGRFSPERKEILNEIRDVLNKNDHISVLFDFDCPNSRDITETVSTLAHISKFIIADLTSAKSIPQELMRIVPSLPSVPVKPIIHECEREYVMFEHFKSYPWVLPIKTYSKKSDIEKFIPEIIDEIQRNDLTKR